MATSREELSKAARSLFQLPQQTSSRVDVGTRAAISIFVPLGVFTLLDQQSIGLQASAGTFTALYAASLNARERAKVLPFVAVGLAICAALGTLLAPWPLIYMAGLVAVAGVASALCLSFRLGPPGPVFFVLVYGLASNVTAVVDGERRSDPLIFLAAAAGGALFAYLLAIVPLMLRRVRAEQARPLSELLPGPWFGLDEKLLTARILIASAIGTVISLLWLDATHAYWTVCACVAVVGLAGGRTLSVTRGLHRVVGTLLGALLYMAIAPLGANPWVLLLLITLLQFVIELVITRNYALGLVFITPLVLLITAAVGSSGDEVTSALERVVDTVIGAALAVATGVMHRGDPLHTGITRVIATIPARQKRQQPPG